MSSSNSPPPPPEITLHPATPADYHALSTLECLTFYSDPFSAVAWGTRRDSEECIAARAAQFASHAPPASPIPTSTPNATPSSNSSSPTPNATPQERRFCTKATLSQTGEIIGFAEWKFVTNRSAQAEATQKAKETEDSKKTDERSAAEILAANEKIWGLGANVKLCEDVFLTADGYMLDSCGGGDYCKLTTLAISPNHQRRGIGTMLLRAGLAEADSLGLQTILAASPVGEGLYKRFGFEEVKVMTLRLWEYEGGESFVEGSAEGEMRHCIMRRPAVVFGGEA